MSYIFGHQYCCWLLFSSTHIDMGSQHPQHFLSVSGYMMRWVSFSVFAFVSIGCIVHALVLILLFFSCLNSLCFGGWECDGHILTNLKYLKNATIMRNLEKADAVHSEECKCKKESKYRDERKDWRKETTKMVVKKIRTGRAKVIQI